MQALRPEVLIQVERDLAIRPRSEPVPSTFQLLLNCLKPVELPVHNNPRPLIFAGNRLVPGREIDNAQPSVTKSHFPIARDPLPLPVRPTVIQAFGRTFQNHRRHRSPARKDSNDSTHTFVVLAWFWILARRESRA